MTKLEKYLSTAVAGIMVCAGAVSAHAQNSYHNTGDLILAFQNPGGETGSDSVLLVSLGSAAQLYRGQTSDTVNIANIGTLLTSTFGSNWYDSGTLHVGALSAWNSNGLSAATLENDPTRTVYVSAARDGLGILGEAGSVGWSGLTGTSLAGASGSMIQIATDLENGGNSFAVVLNLGNTVFDNNNPFVTGSQQGTAYGAFTGGTQFQFSGGSLGQWNGADIEGAIDLYRFQARNNIAGQYGFGEANGAGEFLGSLLIDQSGNISYAAIPEPSSILLVGSAGLLWVLRRRKKSASAA